MSTAFFRIGEIARPHGVHGAVKVNPTTDDSRRFRGLCEAFLELHGEYLPVQLSVSGITPTSVVVEIAGYETPEQANALRGAYLCVDRAHAVRLPKDTYFVADLIGCKTFDTEGNAFGTVTDVFETGANDVYEIEKGRLLVPALKRVLHEVNVEEQRIVFDADVLKEVGLFAD
ncbi:MAG: 16S rRNA processing protein RimM [Clostridia bacterium]|nr:16S rRNA processing protein RimM [Clostridia bacterium]